MNEQTTGCSNKQTTNNILSFSLCLFGQILLEFVFRTFLSTLQILQQTHHVRLQQTKTLRTTYRHLVLLHLLQLIHPITNIHPTTSRTVLYYRVSWILLRSHLIDRLAIALQYFACVSGSDSSVKHGGVGSDANIANGEEIVF